MTRPITAIVAALLGASAAFVAAAGLPSGGDAERPGGDTTVHATGQNAFSFPAANLDEAGRTRFAVGNSFFRRNWVEAPSSTAARDGLGPHFIARSCGGCHVHDGRGAPPVRQAKGPSEQAVALVIRLSVPGTGPNGGPAVDPIYGDQLNTSSVRGVMPEGRVTVTYREIAGRFADGQRYSLRAPDYRITHLAYGPLHPAAMTGPRIAPQLIGVGLIEAIPERAIRENAEEQAKRPDPIQGSMNRVWDVFAQAQVIGRFGWKANVGSIAHQTASAFHADIGITSSRFPNEACTPRQTDCLAAPRGNRGDQPEIDDATLANVVFYQAMLAPPARRAMNDPEVRRGETLFHEAQCAVCHRPAYVTGEPRSPSPSSAALAKQKIFPYTDLLVHDMGPGLADGRPDFEANGQQWRTPPLWGIGLIPEVNGHRFLLHDGRARGVMEAILWHAGEAESAKRRVLQMSRHERKALVRFVESL